MEEEDEEEEEISRALVGPRDGLEKVAVYTPPKDRRLKLPPSTYYLPAGPPNFDRFFFFNAT